MSASSSTRPQRDETLRVACLVLTLAVALFGSCSSPQSASDPLPDAAVLSNEDAAQVTGEDSGAVLHGQDAAALSSDAGVVTSNPDASLSASREVPYYLNTVPGYIDRQVAADMASRGTSAVLAFSTGIPWGASSDSAETAIANYASYVADAIAKLRAVRPDFEVDLYAWPYVLLSHDQVCAPAGLYLSSHVVLMRALVLPEERTAYCNDAGMPVDDAGTLPPYRHGIGDPALRERYRSLLAELILKTGASGVHFDLMGWDAETWKVACPVGLADAGEAARQTCSDYESSATAFLDELGSTLGSLPIALGKDSLTFNGFWNQPGVGPELQEVQERLLDHATGADMEFFGFHRGLEEFSFWSHMKPYVDLLGRHPEKTLWVYGRSDDSYSDYQTEQQLAQSIYAGYLLGSTPRSRFKQIASFGAPDTFGRVGAVDLNEIHLLDPGAATDSSYRFDSTQGVFWRTFEHGLAAYAPSWDSLAYHRSWPIPDMRPLYRADGTSAGAALSFTTNERGFVLVDSPARALAPRERSISAQQAAQLGLPDTSLVTSDGPAYLAFVACDPRKTHLRDLAIDLVRAPRPPTELHLSVRLPQDTSKAQLVAEIDESPTRKRIQAVVEVVTDAQVCQKDGLGPMLQFRFDSQPWWPDDDDAWRDKTHMVKDPAAYLCRTVPRGEWTEIVIRESFAWSQCAGLADNVCTIRRWSHIRFNGPVDFREVKVFDPP